MTFPMPINNIQWHRDLRDKSLKDILENKIGFIKAEIIAPKDMYYPVLPVRSNKTDKTIFPVGEWVGTFIEQKEIVAVEELPEINSFTKVTLPGVIDEEAPLFSVACAAAITSYARIYMHQTITDLYNKGINVYYMDTDGLVINAPMDVEQVSSIELGKFKLEYNIKEGIFILPKTVAYKLHDEQIILKAKGVAKPEYSWEWFSSVINKRVNEKQTIMLLYKKDISALTIKQQEITIYFKELLYDKINIKLNYEGKRIETQSLKI
nr:putative DNA polymerase [Oedogonium sp. 1_circle_47180]